MIVFRATFAMVLFILMGQILLFTLTRCRGLIEEDQNMKNREEMVENSSAQISLMSEKNS